MRRRLPLVAALAVAFTVALLGAPAGATAPAAKNGCKYLKLAEVNRITGLTFVKGEAPPAPASSAVCGYAVAGDPSTAVNLWVQPGSSGAAGFKAAKKAFAANAETVSGLGSKAFYAGDVHTVYVLKGGTLAYLQYLAQGNPDEAALKDATVKLTKVVNGRV
jgi:hypothetical protein